MAIRAKTSSKREALKNALRERCARGQIGGERPLPGVRELAAEFALSKDVTALALRELVDEGLLYTLPRVGTFVRAARSAKSDLFAMISHVAPDAPHGSSALTRGFEDAIAGFGATPLVMEGETLAAAHQNGELGGVAGVFDIATQPDGAPFWTSRFAGEGLPCVRIGDELNAAPGYDLVSFDNRGGGARATAHLLEQGHRRIAFLGAHIPARMHPRLSWSNEREDGWRAAMNEAGLETENLAFHPAHAPAKWGAEQLGGWEDVLAVQVWEQLHERRDITAFVAANDSFALEVLRHIEANWPPSQWPAVVGFDGERAGRDHLLSSLRLPWDELGRAAAQTLWARSHGELPRASQLRRVEMKLIPRLSCHFHGASPTRSRRLVAA